MKLIFCPECQDVKKLSYEMTYCNCGKSYGRYVDNLNAEINETSIPIGFNNYSFVSALKRRPDIGLGERFEAFIIERLCSSIKIIKD